MVTPIPFWKVQATGNDFIFILEKDLPASMGPSQIEALCLRKTGIGADGFVVLKEVADESIDFQWIFYNADGGCVDMCGNAARCAALLWMQIKNLEAPKFLTSVGTVNSFKEGEESIRIRYRLSPRVIKEINSPCGGLFEKGYLTNTGVPHCVIPVETLDSVMSVTHQLNDYIFSDEFGAEGANLTFYSVDRENKIQSVTFERGVNNFTLSCGTGAIASTFIYQFTKKSSGLISIDVPGGELKVNFDSEYVELIGPAQIVYKGLL